MFEQFGIVQIQNVMDLISCQKYRYFLACFKKLIRLKSDCLILDYSVLTIRISSYLFTLEFFLRSELSVNLNLRIY